VKFRPGQYLAVALAVIVLPGCARSVDGTPVPAENFVANYDISRLGKLENEFPPGYDRTQTMPVTTLGPAADTFSNLGVGEIIAINPPNCQSLLQPVHAPRDAQFTLVGGIGKGAIMVSAVKSPEPLAKRIPSAGCQHATVVRKVGRRQYKSKVTRLPGPSLDGVTTTGSMDVAAVGGARSYVFAAFLGDTIAVVVQGLLPGNPQADEVLEEMLVKAVDAIRTG
jgi:Domain of unknown function (DUF5642)